MDFQINQYMRYNLKASIGFDILAVNGDVLLVTAQPQQYQANNCQI